MRRLLAARGLVSALAVLGAALVAVVGYVVLADPLRPTQRYCALMPDSIGLYPGSHVRLRGVIVGTVATLRPENTSVRVDFNIDARYGLHGEVGAATVAHSLAADRDLALLSGPADAARWDRDRCVTRALTPKSITETLRAADTLADTLHTEDPQLIRATLDALSTATTGTGAQFNALVTGLGSAVREPDTAVAQIGTLIDTLSALSARVAANWAEIESVLTRFPGVFEQLNNEIFAQLAELVDSLRVVLGTVNDVTRRYGGVILDGLDALVPYTRLLAANAGTLQQVIDRVPALAGAFTRATAVDGHPAIVWKPPSVQLPRPLSAELCTAVRALAPGGCPARDGLATVDLTDLIAMAQGAR
ncbi:MlaD family protein [Nocardia otitidiscaviarum]|uniref:MlaD family protein n=1 Tax=Nocardia otitidiscaviarum TaxID=1823 RepID=UPI00245500BF|nr:MlaD family protein [Nocardia otitidiscaviarum]